MDALSGVTGRPVERHELVRESSRRLRWVELGAGPTVVLVAGSGEMCLDWATVLPELAESYRVIAYDRAGAGASDPMPRLTIDAEIDDLAALLDEVGPAVAVGHSWGGLLVQLTALRHPKPFRGLVLVDSSYEAVLASVPWHLRLAERGMGIAVVSANRVGLFRRLAEPQGRNLAEASTDDPTVQQLIVDAYLESYSRPNQVAMIRDEARLTSRGIASMRRMRADGSLPDVPLVALSATEKPEQIRRPSLTAAANLCASVPRGRHVVVEGSGHYIHHDHQAAVSTAIAEVVDAAELDR
ncbi:MAG TPA: alpha/beta hydrolase [Nocardioidaceae bacterium]|nr:alpha/beta hydrolase [Nocardioidaceae bacterium]